jgi:hypothetical protein
VFKGVRGYPPPSPGKKKFSKKTGSEKKIPINKMQDSLDWSDCLSKSIWAKKVDWSIYEKNILHESCNENNNNTGFFRSIFTLPRKRRSRYKYTQLGYLKKRK